jgi:hypothetical protein
VGQSEGARQLGAEEDDLGGVVNPYQQDDDRRCRTVGGLQTLTADVPADRELAEVEQHRGGDRTRGHVAPADLGVGKPFEQHTKQHREYGEGQHEIYAFAHGRNGRAAPTRQRGETCAHHQRHHEEKSQPENAGHRDEVGAQIPPHASLRGLLHVPDRIHRILELNHHTQRRYQQQDDACHCRQSPRMR